MTVKTLQPYQAIKSRFPCFVGDARFHTYPESTELTVSVSAAGNRHLTLNRTASDILEMCDGRTDVETISKRFQKKYNASASKVENSLNNLLNEVYSAQLIRLMNHAAEHRIIKTGSRDYYVPQKMSLEITSRCNQKCRHCYGSFDEAGGEGLPLPQLQRLVEGLITSGIKGLTITGGEPFLYREITEFLSWVFPRMELIGIISNGTCIPEAVFDILAGNKGKMSFQTTINGRREYHDRFAQYPGSFDKAVANIHKLVDRGILLRLAMNVNHDNIVDIEYVAELANDLGVANMSASVSHNIGREKSRRLRDPQYRGKNHDDNIDMINRITSELGRVRRRFPKLFGKPPDYSDILTTVQSPRAPGEDIKDKMFTCGAGQKSVHMRPNGDLVLCAIAETCEFPRLGNLLQNSLDEIMTSPVARVLADISVPVPAICDAQCKHFAFCGGCIVRGFTKYRQDKDNCPWGTMFFDRPGIDAIIKGSDLN